MRVQASIQGRHENPFLAPLVGADHGEQFAQGQHAVAAIGFPQGFAASRAHILSTLHGQLVIRAERHEQTGEQRRTLTLPFAVPGKQLGGRKFCHVAQDEMAIRPPRQFLHQASRRHPVAAPEQRTSGLQCAEGCFGIQRIDHIDRQRHRQTRLAAPARPAGLTVFLPLKNGMHAIDYLRRRFPASSTVNRKKR